MAINDEKIFKIGKEINMPKTDKKINLKNLLVLPGLIDAHVHLRDEGKKYKEDFQSGTAAAAAGGITTVLDMPNNDPRTMNGAALRRRRSIAQRKIFVNVGFFSEFPKKTKEIDQILEEGAIAFKLYLSEQVGGLNIDSDDALLKAFRKVESVPIAIHAEDKNLLEKNEFELKSAGFKDASAFLKAHSENVEENSIKRMLSIVTQTKTKLHFCHVSSKNGLKAIIDGKKIGLNITCEVTPHHLFLSLKDFQRIGSLALTIPPVREEHHKINLWKRIKKGWVDIIASDHAPHTLMEKNADLIWDVNPGISGLETTLPLLLTEVNNEKLTLSELVRLTSENPAKIFNLKGRASLKEGKQADLVIIDLKKQFKIDSSNFFSKATFSPFDGKKVQGKPVKTFVAGQLIFDEGELVGKKGSGKILRRN